MAWSLWCLLYHPGPYLPLCSWPGNPTPLQVTNKVLSANGPKSINSLSTLHRHKSGNCWRIACASARNSKGIAQYVLNGCQWSNFTSWIRYKMCLTKCRGNGLAEMVRMLRVRPQGKMLHQTSKAYINILLESCSLLAWNVALQVSVKVNTAVSDSNHFTFLWLDKTGRRSL